MIPTKLLEHPKAQLWYQKLLNIFGFDQKWDQKAMEILTSLLKKNDLEKQIVDIQTLCEDKTPFFFGAGPNLENHLKLMQDFIKNNRDQLLLVAADGAALGLKEFGLNPDLIFTDLDGVSVRDLRELFQYTPFFVIHGHGDNIPALSVLSDPGFLTIRSKCIGTTQTPAKFPIINPGGFTDGDRDLFFMHCLYPRSSIFTLFGYQLDGLIGKYSKPQFTFSQPLSTFKKKKLEVCKNYILELQLEEQRLIRFFTPPNSAKNYQIEISWENLDEFRQ